MENYVMDACALIALLVKEQGGEKVQALLDRSSSDTFVILLHRVTLIEVLYDQLRANPDLTAESLIGVISALPLVITNDLSDGFISLTAGFKIRHRVSFADCFVLALAKLQNAKVLTSDHHEFDSIEQADEIDFEWIR